MPKWLILDVGHPLAQLLGELQDKTYPTSDTAAVLSQLVDVVVDTHDFENRLANAASWMGAGEGLFECSYLESAQIEKLTNAVVYLGRAIQNKLEHFHAYSNGICPYSFWSLVDDTAILLVCRQLSGQTHGHLAH